MGFNREGVAFLRWCHANGTDFTTTATLGRQELHLSTGALSRLVGGRAARILTEADGYAEPLLAHFGAVEVTSIDASSYEHATVVHDLNTDIPEALVGQFSAVIDGGTLEHIFDYPTALRNALRLVSPDGHFIAISPTSNLAGHGFYQLSPELFFRVLRPNVTGFVVERMFLCGVNRRRWFEVLDPDVTGRRQQFMTLGRTNLYVIARHVDIDRSASEVPQQSDYVAAWRRWAERPNLQTLKRHVPKSIRMVKGRVDRRRMQPIPWRLSRRAFRRTKDLGERHHAGPPRRPSDGKDRSRADYGVSG